MKKNILLKLCISFVGLWALIGCATTSVAREASTGTETTAVITDIRVENGNVVIKSNKGFAYTIFNGSDPYKTTIEIPDMSVGTFTNRIVSDNSGVAEIMPRQSDSPNRSARIDIVLLTPSVLTPSYENNTLVLSIRKEEPVAVSKVDNTENQSEAAPLAAVAETPARAVTVADENIQPLSKATQITGIELQKNADAVKVIISGNGSMTPNVFPINERIVVDIPGVALNTTLPEKAFSPLKGIRAGKHKDKLRLVLDVKEKTNFDVSAAGSSIEISLLAHDTKAAQTPSRNSEEISSLAKKLQTAQAQEPKTTPAPSNNPDSVVVTSAAPARPAQSNPEAEPLIEGEFTGKKISLDFQDADIVPIFRLLGDVSGYNIVLNPDVKGKITLKLINVPWDQALDIILRTFSLAKIVDGNIIRIVPTSMVAKELDDVTRAKKAKDEAGDLKTKVFPVNYADLAKLKDMIDKAKIVSSRGSVTLDERGSTIIVNDLDKNLEQIDALIKQLDQEVLQARQVMIEAKIIEVSTSYTKDLGIQWGAFFANSDGKQTGIIGPNGRQSDPTAPNYLVNLPGAPGSAGNIGFGYINKAAGLVLDLQLSAMEQLQKGKVISSPKIMTMNNQEAKITTGSTIYLQSTASGSNLASFTAVDATLSLTVKPRIAPGGAIFMDIDITKDAPGPVISGNVSVTKNTAKTSVLVNDADTVVIGGIITASETNVNDAVPGFSKIPLLGRLFQKDNSTDEKREVLIFITPRILEFSSLK